MMVNSVWSEKLACCTESIRVAVAQIGARRNYAVPVAFQREGLLVRFYTDFYAPKSLFGATLRCFARFLPLPVLRRAAARSGAEISPEIVVHFPSFALAYKLQKQIAARQGTLPRAYVWGGKRFCELVIKHGFPKVDVLFCFSSAAREIFTALDGLPVLKVVDQEIPPLAFEYHLVRQQELAYPEWTARPTEWSAVEEYTERQRKEWELADIILCPSRFCERALVSEAAPLSKIRIVPFGIHDRFFAIEPSRDSRSTLRVLFVGNTPIRKGLPDLVLALKKLDSRFIEAVFVGEPAGLSKWGYREATKVGRFLGSVPRADMPKLYQSADVLVLPTVSDVFPAVVLEAMAAGLPVITTPNCGSSDAVRDGVDGFIVPVRSPEEIAARLELLAKDRALLLEMGKNAAEQARNYTLLAYQQRLINLIRKELNSKRDS